MTHKASQPATEHYIVPARQLSGAPDSSLGAVVLGGCRPGVHRDTDVLLGKRACFVRAVTRHRDQLAIRLLAPERHLVLRLRLREKVVHPRFAGDLRSTDRVSPVTSRFATGRTYDPGAVTTSLGKLALRAAADEVRDRARI